MSSHPDSLKDLAQRPGSGVADLQQRALLLRRLNQAYAKLVGEPLASQSRVANLRQGTLVIEVASAAWLTRLRYQREELLSQFRQQIHPSLTSLDLRINPAAARRPGSPEQRDVLTTPIQGQDSLKENRRRISSEAAARLKELAADAPPGLKEKLERLAALSERRRTDDKE
ncbi:DciA family protein [Gallaecimonas sp. GXIMD4217]|uniref:DUF721 domain-containing protein n=1 Tax=Gallaecimonas sp. GXIMD4217 TaxID=3131927 RepID=UPI00311B19FC